MYIVNVPYVYEELDTVKTQVGMAGPALPEPFCLFTACRSLGRRKSPQDTRQRPCEGAQL